MKKYFFIFWTAILLMQSQLLQAEGFDFSASYLYWRPHQSTMNFGIVSSADITKPLLQKNDGASGYRLGLGYYSPNCWQTHFFWTHYHNSFSQNASGLAGTPLGVFLRGGTAHNVWKLSFDTYDLNLGHLIYRNDFFSCVTAIGLKGATIKQNQVSNYSGLSDGEITGIIGHFEIKNNFDGIGPTIGLECAYSIFYNIKILCKGSTGILYGRFSNDIFGQANSTGPINDGFKFAEDKLIPEVELYLGLDWSKPIRNYCATISLGYEIQYFWNMWRTHNTFDRDLDNFFSGFSDLMLNGLTLKLGIGF